MKTWLLGLFPLFVLLSCAEQKTKEKSDTLKKDTTHGNVVKSDTSKKQGVPKDRLVFYYDGMIGKTLSIEVTLYEYNDSLSGKYRYTSQVTFLTLKGVVNGSQYELTEYDAKGKLTGYFKGEKDAKTQQVKGIWTNTKGNKAFPFYLTLKGQTNEHGDVTIGAKEVILKDAEGCTCASVFIPVALEGLYPEKMDAVNALLSFEKLTDQTKEEACQCNGGLSFGLVSGSYNVEYNQNMILSIEWWGETMAAYPSSYTHYININLNTGLSITLNDMFNDQAKAYIVEKVNKEINERLKNTAQTIIEEEQSEEIAQDLCHSRNISWESLSSFSFTKEGVIIHYELYFPHYALCYDPGGNVLFSYSEFNSGMLAKNSVLEPLVK